MSKDQDRRVNPKISCTLDPVEKRFLDEVFIPANQFVKKHHADKGYSGAINLCIKAVRGVFERENGGHDG